MDQLWELIRESLPEALGGLVAAAILAFIATAYARMRKSPSEHPPVGVTDPSASPPVEPRRVHSLMEADLDQQRQEELIAIKQRRLHELKKKQAVMGLNTPPEILIEIKELEEDIHKLGE